MLSETLNHAVLVVAHPDDEILWFSSIVDRVAAIIVCYLDVPGQSEWTTGRRRVVSEYPLASAAFLGLTESVAFAGADWLAPVVTESGLAIQRRPGTLPGFSRERYESNYQSLKTELTERLRDCSVVITHNPWGEYGHEEHVQVHRVVTSLQVTLGFDVWYSNYCSDRSYPLMLREIVGRRSDYETLPTNPALARSIEDLYRKCGCWTWPFDDYVHFASESFLKHDVSLDSRGSGTTLPLNFIKLDDPLPQQAISRTRRIARAARRRLLGFGVEPNGAL